MNINKIAKISINQLQVANLSRKSAGVATLNSAIHSSPAFSHVYLPANVHIKRLESVAEKFSFKRLEKHIDSINSDRAKAILDLLIKTCKKENIIGEGKQHVAFNIPGCDEFVLRVLKSEDIKMGTLQKSNIPLENFNLGQPVASLIGSGAEVQFMRKVKGESIGTPYTLLKKARKEVVGRALAVPGEADYVSNIKKIASIPQEAFDRLAMTIKHLKKHGYVFDIANPNNLLLDTTVPGKPKFNIIDDLISIDELQNQYSNRAWKGTLQDLLYPLLDASAGKFYMEFSESLNGNSKLAQETCDAGKMIFEKCISAAQKAELESNVDNLDLETLSRITGIDKNGITSACNSLG